MLPLFSISIIEPCKLVDHTFDPNLKWKLKGWCAIQNTFEAWKWHSSPITPMLYLEWASNLKFCNYNEYPENDFRYSLYTFFQSKACKNEHPQPFLPSSCRLPPKDLPDEVLACKNHLKDPAICDCGFGTNSLNGEQCQRDFGKCPRNPFSIEMIRKCIDVSSLWDARVIFFSKPKTIQTIDAVDNCISNIRPKSHKFLNLTKIFLDVNKRRSELLQELSETLKLKCTLKPVGDHGAVTRIHSSWAHTYCNHTNVIQPFFYEFDL